MESYNAILALLEASNKDVEKFSKGNKAAGKRLRKALLDIGKLTKTSRKEIQTIIDAE